MIRELLDTGPNETIPDLCDRLGRFLGLDGPVPANVLLRAIDDEMFASNLITCRGTPGFLDPLLNDPKNRRFGPAAMPEPAAPGADPGNLQLVAKATSAFISWGRAGFSVADTETLARREDACLACPNIASPRRMVQKLAGAETVAGEIGKRLGNKICTECGCSLSRKIKLTSEFCPAAHPDDPTLTRWGEPIVA